MRRKQNFQAIAWFWDLFKRDMLNLDPPYQRRSVWNQSYKDLFIDTILLGYPAPAVFLFEEITPDGVAKYNVVDGKQRLSTIFEFANNRFPVSEKAERTEVRGSYFKELSDETKKDFWMYQFSVEYLPTTQESIVNDIFNRINRNTAKLTAQELRHAQFDGEFISAAEELADWMTNALPQNFPNIASKSRKQMKDVEFVAHLLLLIEVGPRGYSTTQLDAEFSDRDEEWPKKQAVVDSFRDVVQIIKKVLSTGEGLDLPKTRLRNQADFYSFFGGVYQLTEQDSLPEIAEMSSRISQFFVAVEDEAERKTDKDLGNYYEAARSASNDSGPRKDRIEIVKRVIDGSWR